MSNVECSICMEIIDISINICTTECGHCFHSSCLIKNISHNGFGCPYCRKVLAENPIQNNEFDESNVNDNNIDLDHIDDQEADYKYNDYELRGLRWLFNRANGEEIEQYGYEKPYEDVYLEEYYEEKDTLKKLLPTSLIKENMLKKNVTYDELIGHIFYLYKNDYQKSYEHQESFKKVYTTMFKLEKTFTPV
uniref:RING-type domain-containing protein n=1 Tax=viral metagenome TaxID=1070528 RepID=A0A6C0IHK2_9ZZZZ